MITKPILFVQIAVNSDHIFGLSPDGDVYYRDKPPYNYNNNTNYSYSGGQKKDDADEKKAWKKLFMEYRVEVPKGGQEREAQSANEPESPPAEVVVDLPARKIYKDADTVKAVQTALKEKGFYRKDPAPDTYKIDGELGDLTVKAIKAFQKSVMFQETGEIDLALWNKLELNPMAEFETVIELDAEEDTNVLGA